jgi:hypothetical protein
MRSYNIDGGDGSNNKVEYTAVFSNNIRYTFKICTELNDADGIVLTIYNSGREIITSNNQGDDIQSEVEFYCNATGIYYLTFTFQNSKRFCGGCILALKR